MPKIEIVEAARLLLAKGAIDLNAEHFPRVDAKGQPTEDPSGTPTAAPSGMATWLIGAIITDDDGTILQPAECRFRFEADTPADADAALAARVQQLQAGKGKAAAPSIGPPAGTIIIL